MKSEARADDLSIRRHVQVRVHTPDALPVVWNHFRLAISSNPTSSLPPVLKELIMTTLQEASWCLSSQWLVPQQRDDGSAQILLMLSSAENELPWGYSWWPKISFQAPVYVLKERFLVSELHGKPSPCSGRVWVWGAGPGRASQTRLVPFQGLDLRGGDRLSRSICRSRESHLSLDWTDWRQAQSVDRTVTAFRTPSCRLGVGKSGFFPAFLMFNWQREIVLFKVYKVLFDMHVDCEMISTI